MARQAISKAAGRANLARLPIKMRATFLIAAGHFLPAGSALRTTGLGYLLIIISAVAY